MNFPAAVLLLSTFVNENIENNAGVVSTNNDER